MCQSATTPVYPESRIAGTGHSSLPGRFGLMFTGCCLMMIMVGSHILRFGQCHMQFHIPTMWQVDGLNCGPDKATYGSFDGHSIYLEVRFWPSLGCKVFQPSQMSVQSSSSPQTWRPNFTKLTRL